MYKTLASGFLISLKRIRPSGSVTSSYKNLLTITTCGSRLGYVQCVCIGQLTTKKLLGASTMATHHVIITSPDKEANIRH